MKDIIILSHKMNGYMNGNNIEKTLDNFKLAKNLII
jgi:hypothetical protein